MIAVGGVFERFPALHNGYLAGALLWWTASEAPHLSKLPSECVRSGRVFRYWMRRKDHSWRRSLGSGAYAPLFLRLSALGWGLAI